MENKKKSVYKVLLALNLVLLAVAFALCIYRYTKATQVNFKICSDSLTILAVVSGFLYAINKYKKNAAQFYKAFMFLVCLEAVAYIVLDMLTTPAYGHTSSVSQVLETIICVNFCMLTFAKDLGEKTSKGIAFSILAVSFINSLRFIILYSSIKLVIARALISIIIAAVAVIFVFEKYYDKTERGTK